jgi:DNA polymerase-3 subunit epsilon
MLRAPVDHQVSPDGEKETKTRRINPTVPIPEGASKVHGIYYKDFENEPTFAQVAKSLEDFLEGCDLSGFNVM